MEQIWQSLCCRAFADDEEQRHFVRIFLHFSEFLFVIYRLFHDFQAEIVLKSQSIPLQTPFVRFVDNLFLEIKLKKRFKKL